MFESGKTYTNRYGDEYSWIVIDENTYRFDMTSNGPNYARWGGKEGQEKMDMNDLGMYDPSGGPYITIGMEIDGRPIKRLFIKRDVFVEVSNDQY